MSTHIEKKKCTLRFCGCENDNFHSGHILVKRTIPSELYCCNMIPFCKLVKIMIVQTSLCRCSFLAGEAVKFVDKGDITLLELRREEMMNLHNDVVLTNIIVKFTSRNLEDSDGCIVHQLFV